MNKWYSGQGNNSDVVLSSKISLVRNLANTPFPCRLSNEARKSVSKKLYAAVKNSRFAGEFDLVDLYSATDIQKISYACKGLISEKTAKDNGYSALLLSKQENISISICSEEHINIYSMTAGQSLDEAYKNADTIDNVFIDSLKIAYDKQLGFLTSNPMKLGTGMRASLVLHLPALRLQGLIAPLGEMVGKLGFSIKPAYINGSDFFELSNEITLGISEQSAIDNLNAICNQIVKQERSIRQELVDYTDFEDKVFRAMGTLKMARRLNDEEFYSLLSLARLGTSMKIFDENEELSYEEIGEMLYTLETATIISQVREPISTDDAQRLRAQYIREKLS